MQLLNMETGKPVPGMPLASLLHSFWFNDL